MNRHLCRCVKLKVGNISADCGNCAKVGNNKRVNPDAVKLGGIADGIRHLSVLNKSVQGNIELYSVKVAVFHRRGKLFYFKIFCKGASAKAFSANINGICPTAHRGIKATHISRRSKKLGEG